jgi:hypothetical protein
VSAPTTARQEPIDRGGRFALLANPKLAGLIALAGLTVTIAGVIIAFLSWRGDEKGRAAQAAPTATVPTSPAHASPTSVPATERPLSGRQFSFHLAENNAVDVDGAREVLRVAALGLQDADDLFYDARATTSGLLAPSGFYGVHEDTPPQRAHASCYYYIRNAPTHAYLDRETPRAGSKFCYLTSSGQMAFANITGVDDTGIMMTVRIWEAPS